MVDVQVSMMMGEDRIRTIKVYELTNLLNNIEKIDLIHTVIGKAAEVNALEAYDTSSRACICLEFSKFTKIRFLARHCARGQTLSEDNSPYRSAGVDETPYGTTFAQQFIIGMRRYDEYVFHPIHYPSSSQFSTIAS